MKTYLMIAFLCFWFPAAALCLGRGEIYHQKDSATTTPAGNTGKPGNTAISPAASPGKPGPAPTLAKVSYVIDVATPRTVGNEKEATVGDLIRIKISNPMEFMDHRPGDRNKLVLYANDRELKGITSDLFNNVSKDSFKTTDSVMWIPFVLIRDSATKAAWDILYRLPGHWYKNKAKVQLSVGWEGMLPLEIAKKDIKNTEVTLIVFSSAVFIWMVISYLVLLIGLGTLVWKTDILKDGLTGAYSLAQTQLAYWTILVLAGFIYSLLITEMPSTMNSSILTLLGISMGTTGIARYIDYFRKLAPVAPAPVAPTGIIIRNAVDTPKTHHNFWRDILGDGESINMQRVQILAWNIVLGAYFTFYTFHNKTMPVIPDVLLTLAGMSSLTYVVAKPTEAIPSDVKKRNDN